MKVGLLGCMAERLKDKLLTTERLVDVVAGPDAYRDLPRDTNQYNLDLRAISVIFKNPMRPF